MEKSWIIYMLALRNNAFYTGITNNLEERLSTHKKGKGSKYVRSHLPFRVIYIQEANNRSEASKAEAAIKKLTRKAKEAMLKSGVDNKISLFCESCGVVISLSRDKEEYQKPEFSYRCVICRNIIYYSEEDKDEN